jgi:hypothetical protein
LKNDVNIPSNREKKLRKKQILFVGIVNVTDEKSMIRSRIRTKSGTLVDSGRDHRNVTDVNSRRESPATVDFSVSASKSRDAC